MKKRKREGRERWNEAGSTCACKGCKKREGEGQ